MLISLSYFSLLQKCKAIEIFILKESGRDGAIGRVFKKEPDEHKSV